MARYLHRPSFDPTISSPSTTQTSTTPFPPLLCICELKLTSISSEETLFQPKAWIPTVLLPKAAAATTVSDIALWPSFLHATHSFELLQRASFSDRAPLSPTQESALWNYSEAILMVPIFLANGCPPFASREQNLAKRAEWTDSFNINPRSQLYILSSVRVGQPRDRTELTCGI